MSKFIKQDAKDFEIPLDVLNKWQFVMDTIWSFLTNYASKEKKVKITNEKNQIKFQLDKGHKFVIGAYMYNNKYISMFVKIEGNDEFEVTLNNADEFGKEGIVKILANILTYGEAIK